jgi:RluA family pseudouridine synthase
VTLRFLHLDERVAAVDKPPGIAVIPRRGEPPDACLRHAVERELGGPVWVVHRLDHDVSGVVLFARTAGAHRDLSLAFERNEVRKVYWALVEGVPVQPEALIELRLRTGGHASRTVVDALRGKPSRTRWRLAERAGPHAILDVVPETGRTHQIRVHLRAIGHPLLVDRRYGHRAELYPSDVRGIARGKHERPAGERPLLARAALHASRLALTLAGEPLLLESPLPADLVSVVEALRSGADRTPTAPPP